METSLNIVDLIENNPITKLSSTYNGKLLTKIQQNFTNFEQQLFVTSFYCYLNCHPINDFVIDLDNVWKWLGFSQKINAKTLLEKNFVLDKDYTKSLHFQVKQSTKSLLLQQKQSTNAKGGHNKETFMLNVKTFKSLCLKAGTKKADEIHDYYMKMEETIHQVVQEESDDLKLQLEQVKNEIEKIDETNKKEMSIKVQREREQILLREFGTAGSLVYIIKVKSFDDGTYIVKIGESRIGVKARYEECRTKHGDILLLDCFSVKRCKDFETFLHKHEKIRFSNVRDLPGHENEEELFLIGKSLTYKTILHVVRTNINIFNNVNEDTMEKLRIENETLRELIQTSNNPQSLLEHDIIQQLLNGQLEMMKIIKNLEFTNKEILEKLNSSQTKTTTVFNQPLVTLGPRLQQINPETMLLTKVYESVAECLKESNFKLKRPSIVKAVNEKTVYGGYRWAFVDRDTDPKTLVNIEPTKQTKVQNLGYIAKLNATKTEILNVYIDRKTAAQSNGYVSYSALDNPVKNGSPSNGHYYVLYDKCDDNLKQQLEEKYGEPLLYKDGVGQYDANNNLIAEFVCKYECIKQLKISDKTLVKTLDKNVTYNNFYFKRIGSKLQIHD
jgi:hypothetical protein